jgi:hypothetical protein
VWFERRAAWGAGVRTSTGDDPHVEMHRSAARGAIDLGPLAGCLHRFVVADTLEGAILASTDRRTLERRGPLGWLGSTVRGGVDPIAHARVADTLRRAYRVVDDPRCGWIGDGSTVLQVEERMFSWMTASDASCRALGRVLGREYPWHCELVVHVLDPPPAGPASGFVQAIGHIDRQSQRGLTTIRLFTLEPELGWAWIRSALGEGAMNRTRAMYERGSGRARSPTFLWPPEPETDLGPPDRPR